MPLPGSVRTLVAMQRKEERRRRTQALRDLSNRHHPSFSESMVPSFGQTCRDGPESRYQHTVVVLLQIIKGKRVTKEK